MPGGRACRAGRRRRNVGGSHPGERFCPCLVRPSRDLHAVTSLIDAGIVTLCREHGVTTTILSADRDFRRFAAIFLRSL